MAAFAIQRTFFDDTLAEWCPPQEFRELEGDVSVDLETLDPLIHSHGSSWISQSGHKDKDGFITGIAVAGPDWQEYYPIRHAGGNLDEEATLRWFRAQARKPNVKWRGYNVGLYDRPWLKYRYDIDFAGPVWDGITAAPLIDENRFSYSLDSVAKTYLKDKKSIGSLYEAAKMLGISNPKGCMHQFPAPFVGPYAEQDARLSWDLYEPFNKIMTDEDLHGIFDLESRLTVLLAEMRYRGCPVNVDRAVQVGAEFERKHKDCLKQIHDLTGHWIDVWNNAEIGKMFDSLSIKYPMTAGGKNAKPQPSITKVLLEHLEHPVGMLLRAARKYALAKGTFIDGHILGHQINGKIHAQFHPLRKDDDEGSGGAVTGRFSSSNPNLQNLPARDEDNPLKDELGEAVRGLFEPWEGENWAAIDYSGQEPRLATHFAAAAKIDGVQVFIDAYKENPKMKFHKTCQKFTGLPYKAAKNMTLGKMYGMGGAKMARDLNLPTKWIENRRKQQIEVAGEEAQKVMDKYNEFMPWVKGLADLAMRRAESRGWIRTLCGRRRRFEPIFKHGAFSYKALNCLIQGSAADQMKKAMVDLYEQEGVVPLVTVHDELGLSVPDRATAERYQQVMLESVTLAIPNAADLEYGPTWGLAV